jgi:hypothetical protein
VRRIGPLVWSVAAVAWIAATVSGLVWLMSYDNRAGLAAAAPLAWPVGSHMTRDLSGPTLVLLAHPRCDCTRASLSELAELMARAPIRPRAFVVFIKPGRVADEWERTALWTLASRIPGVAVLRDDSGAEANRFGAATSGQTLLYDKRGRLAFSGGVTAARGKEGGSVGRASILALLGGRAATAETSPVFGCSLFGPADEPVATEAHHHGS